MGSKSKAVATPQAEAKPSATLAEEIRAARAQRGKGARFTIETREVDSWSARATHLEWRVECLEREVAAWKEQNRRLKKGLR